MDGSRETAFPSSPILALFPLARGEKERRGEGREFPRGELDRLCTPVCLSLSARVFVSVCIAVPSAKRRVQEHAEVHEHVLHGDVHRRVHTEDRRIRRQGKLHYKHQQETTLSSPFIEQRLLERKLYSSMA